jgi:hypothetical protein
MVLVENAPAKTGRNPAEMQAYTYLVFDIFYQSELNL